MSQIDIIVKELRFDLDLGGNIDFDNVVLNISNLTDNFLIPELQKRINAFFVENEDIVFDRIVINLGQISLKDKNLISKNISNKLIKEFQKSGQLRNPNFESNEILILYFLRFGFLPWWASSHKKFNEILSKHSYQENLKQRLYAVVTKNKFNFHRFFNALDSKNKTIFFREYLRDNYTYFTHSTLFIESLLETISGKIASKDKTLIHYELFIALINHKNESEVAFSLVLKKVIEDFNIEWKTVKEVFLSKPIDKKSFLNLLEFDEVLFFSNQLPTKNNISNLAQIRRYIEFGALNELKSFGLPFLTVEFSKLLKREKKSLNILFHQLGVYQDPIKIFRISKLLNLSNLHDYLKLTFEPSHSFLLRHSFSFLKFMESKGAIKNPSFFYFINTIIKLETSSTTKKKYFYNKLINLLSDSYRLDYGALLVDFYFFSASQEYQTQFQDVIELFYARNTSRDDHKSVVYLINQLKRNPKFSYATLLSSNQRDAYRFLIDQILFLNQSVVLNSWSRSDTETFIFNQLIKQKSSENDLLLSVLKAYAKANNFDIHRLVIAVLMKFHPTDLLIEKHGTDFLEYVFLLNKPEVTQKLSKKEQLFIQKIVNNDTFKNKLEHIYFVHNSEYDVTLLSSAQRSAFNFLKDQIRFLNRSIVSNSWTDLYSEAFIFNALLEQNVTTKNRLLDILKVYAKSNGFKTHQLVLAVLMKFYPTANSVEIGRAAVLEYILFVIQAEVYQNFSKKEQQFIQKILNNDTFKNKLEHISFIHNSEYDVTVLSSAQRSVFNLLKDQIKFLNRSIVSNSWKDVYTETLIFKTLRQQNGASKNSLLDILKVYAKSNGFKVHQLVLAVLMKFYPTASAVERGRAAVLEYILFVIQTEVYQKFSKKEQQFIQKILNNDTFKNKLEHISFIYNSEYDVTVLSSAQRSAFNLLKDQIKFLNIAIVLNSWTDLYSETFIFNALLEQNGTTKNSLLAILKVYAKSNGFKVHQLVLAVLIKFYPTANSIEIGRAALLEYILFVIQAEVYQKFSKKEQQFVQEILNNSTFKNKLDHISFIHNSEYDVTVLSSAQRSAFNLLKDQIKFLNIAIVLNSWTDLYSKTFIFNALLEQNVTNKNSLLDILKVYAKSNGFKVHQLVLAVLIKFYPTASAVERGRAAILEYILFVIQADVYQKFSKKEQQFIQEILNNDTFKNKLEHISFISNSEYDVTVLSSTQRSAFNLLKDQIRFLNIAIVLNSWTDLYTETFIFKTLRQQNVTTKNSLLAILKDYAKSNGFKVHQLVLAVLMKFYPTANLVERGRADVLEYILFVIQADVYQKFSKKEQQFVQEILNNSTFKNKLEHISFTYNSDFPYLTEHSDIKEFQNQDKSFNQNLNYLFKEINSIIDSDTVFKINKNQLLQILIIKLKKETSKKKLINYQVILEHIAEITNTDIKKLTISLLKRIGNKTRYSSNDVILLHQINDSFFSFSNLKQASRKSINDVIKLIQKISDQSIQQKLITDYIVNSSIVVLKLKDKNYKSLIDSLSANKKNNFFKILTNILSILPYQKRIEFSLRLKQKALLFSQEKNVSDEQFYQNLSEEIQIIDASLFKKIKPQLALNMNAFFDISSVEKSENEIDKKSSKNTKLEFDNEAAIEKRAHFEIKNYNPINSLNKRDFDYFLNLKNELNREVKPALLKSKSYANLEEILASETKFIDFLIRYIDDFELLIEFAQASFTEPIKSYLKGLLNSYQPEIGKLEKQLIQLHKVSLFTTLNRLEFKIILRVYILKSLAYYKQNRNYSVAEFTLNFIENLSKNGKINFRQTSSIVNYIEGQSTLEKQIKEGVVSFFDRNNFEFIQKKVKEIEFFKNNIHFFILNNQKYDGDQEQKLTTLETIDFLESRIKNADKQYVREFLLEEKTASFFALEFKNRDKELHLEVFKLLEIPNNNAFSILKFYEQIIKLKKASEKHLGVVFEQIIKEVLWKQPSVLYLFDTIYTKLKKENKLKEFQFILELEKYYPPLKLILGPVKKLENTEKIELIRYYIQSGKLPEALRLKKDIYLQLLKAYTNKEQLKLLFLEFSASKMVSKHFIEMSSRNIFVDAMLEALGTIDTDFKYIFDVLLQTDTSLTHKNEYLLFDVVLNYVIAPKNLHQSNLKIIMTTVKAELPKVYQNMVKIMYKLVSNSPNLNTNIALIAYLNTESFSENLSEMNLLNFKIGKNTLSNTLNLKQNSPLLRYIVSESNLYASISSNFKGSITLKDVQVEFDTFINQIRYFVEFKSFDRASGITDPSKLYETVLKFKSKLILKKQLYSWSKQPSKITVLLKLFPDQEVTKLIEFVHPNQLESIKTFNEVLKILKYSSLQEYLKLNSIQKFTAKVLLVWSKQNIIMNSPDLVLYRLFEEALLHPDMDAKQVFKQLETVLTDLNTQQANVVKAILIQANSAQLEKKSLEPIVVEEAIAIPESEGSIYINNAGLILIWPFLSTLFNKLGLLNGRSFIDDASLQKAILVTQYVIFEGDENEESNLVLNKILCGVAPSFFVDTKIELNEMEKNIAKSVLRAVTGNWEQLKNTSMVNFKETFLKREGIIQKVDSNYKLIVEKKPFDMLLRTIPWNISMIQNSFMGFRLIVEWEN